MVLHHAVLSRGDWEEASIGGTIDGDATVAVLSAVNRGRRMFSASRAFEVVTSRPSMPEGYPVDHLSPSYQPELAMRGVSRGG